MGGCGGHCRCGNEPANKEGELCATPKGGVALDANGKCPCGKSAEECCLSPSSAQGGHSAVLKKAKPDDNPAVGELCEAHGLAHLCG